MPVGRDAEHCPASRAGPSPRSGSSSRGQAPRRGAVETGTLTMPGIAISMASVRGVSLHQREPCRPSHRTGDQSVISTSRSRLSSRAAAAVEVGSAVAGARAAGPGKDCPADGNRCRGGTTPASPQGLSGRATAGRATGTVWGHQEYSIANRRRFPHLCGQPARLPDLERFADLSARARHPVSREAQKA